jgi:hypothetical protein
MVDFRLLSDARDLDRLADAFRLAASVLLAPSLGEQVLEVFPSTYSARVKRLLRPSRLNGALTALAGPVMDRNAFLRSRILAVAQEGEPLDVLLHDDAALRAHLRRHVGCVWHPCGTYRLGDAGDPMAVCDPTSAVIGVGGLMVCDASVMPTIPCANLNIPVMMIAEKVADGDAAPVVERVVAIAVRVGRGALGRRVFADHRGALLGDHDRGRVGVPGGQRRHHEASTTRRPPTPRTRSRASTTLAGSPPMRQVPTGW